MTNGFVSRIIPFSSVDGPGNRTVIFLQGCNFNCGYCHNPETINYCDMCGACIGSCIYGALSMDKDGTIVWDKHSCKDCGACILACQNSSNPKVKKMSVKEILKVIDKNKAFISGITISGGECTLQWNFVFEIFKNVKAMGLSTYLDTNGYVEREKLIKLFPVMDKVMLDIKSYDSKEHINLTGKDNKIVLDNFEFLAKENKIYEVRTVIVPEVLDNMRNVDMISKLIVNINPNIRYKLIKFRPMGVREEFSNKKEPSDELMAKLKEKAMNNGCANVLTV